MIKAFAALNKRRRLSNIFSFFKANFGPIIGKLLGFTSEQAWHRFVIGNLFPKALFPERSRYNRRCPGAWLCDQMDAAPAGQARAAPCVCGRGQLADRAVSFSSNASRQTIPWNCRYWLLCFQKGHFLWVETSPAGHRPRASDGICCHRSVLSRPGGRWNRHDANSTSI